MRCGRNCVGKMLHVDHILPKSKFKRFKYDVRNLQILCDDCNVWKGSTRTNDFRTPEQRKVFGVITEVTQAQVMKKSKMNRDDRWAAKWERRHTREAFNLALNYFKITPSIELQIELIDIIVTRYGAQSASLAITQCGINNERIHSFIRTSAMRGFDDWQAVKKLMVPEEPVKIKIVRRVKGHPTV